MTDLLSGAGAQRGGKYHLYIKIGILVLLILGSLIPLGMVRGLVLERKALSSSVEHQLAATWGGAQRIVGPILVVPFEEDELRQVPSPDRSARAAYVEQLVTTRHLLYLLPEELDIDGRTTTSIRRRGIYEVPLFTADMRFAGRFGPPDLTAIDLAPEHRVLWDEAWVEAYVSDLSGTLNPIVLNWDGRSIPFRVGTEEVSLSAQIVAPLALENAESLSEAAFAFEIELNGSDSIGALPLGRATRMALASDWPHPSFFGGVLPTSSSIGPEGFEADWQVSHFARQLPQQWRDNEVKLDVLISRARGDGLAVRMVESVDHYLKAE
ncbi:MAG: inner membrane CreD family protein, partial [Acidobacteriota bacterium]